LAYGRVLLLKLNIAAVYVGRFQRRQEMALNGFRVRKRSRRSLDSSCEYGVDDPGFHCIHESV
jgi:hypothetical protein